MSDPMTRTDIEDVLSSIRRLVSEETRPEPPLRAPGAAPRAPDPSVPEPKLSGRLVLTPALRVAGVPDAANDAPEETVDAGGEAPVALDASLDAAADAPDLVKAGVAETEDVLAEEIDGVAIQTTIAELEVAVAARIEQWDPDGTEAAVEDENHSDAFAGPVRFFHRGADPAAPEGTIRATRVTPARLTPESRRREAEPAEDEAPDGRASAHAAPAVSPAPRAATISAVDALAETLAQCEEAADALSDPRAAEAPTFHSGRTAAPEAEAAPELEAAAPEAAATEWEDTAPEAAAPETAAPEAAAMEWEDTAPEEAPDLGADQGQDFATGGAFADLEPEVDEGAQTASGAEAEPDGAFLDEEALRDIVREMIRQELQGSLGERITRSVRKLVRAEINRAFASRDLE